MQILSKFKWLCQQPEGTVYVCTLKPNNVGGRWRDKGEYVIVPLVPQFGDSLYQITEGQLVKILEPPPLPVDTPLWVGTNVECLVKRHLSHFDIDGTAWCFAEGRTSWTQANTLLENWKLWRMS